MSGGRASSILKLFWGDQSKKTPCRKVKDTHETDHEQRSNIFYYSHRYLKQGYFTIERGPDPLLFYNFYPKTITATRSDYTSSTSTSFQLGHRLVHVTGLGEVEHGEAGGDGGEGSNGEIGGG